MHFTCLGSHLLLLRLISCFPFAFCHAKVQLPACSPWGGPWCPVSLLPQWETQTSPRSPQLQLAPDAASRETASNLPSVLLPSPTQTKVAKVTHWKLSCRKPRSPIAGRKAVGGRHGARAAGPRRGHDPPDPPDPPDSQPCELRKVAERCFSLLICTSRGQEE